jgi:hypothetical protein
VSGSLMQAQSYRFFWNGSPASIPSEIESVSRVLVAKADGTYEGLSSSSWTFSRNTLALSEVVEIGQAVIVHGTPRTIIPNGDFPTHQDIESRLDTFLLRGYAGRFTVVISDRAYRNINQELDGMRRWSAAVEPALGPAGELRLMTTAGEALILPVSQASGRCLEKAILMVDRDFSFAIPPEVPLSLRTPLSARQFSEFSEYGVDYGTGLLGAANFEAFDRDPEGPPPGPAPEPPVRVIRE